MFVDTVWIITAGVAFAASASLAAIALLRRPRTPRPPAPDITDPGPPMTHPAIIPPTVSAGEREAAWAASAASTLLARLRSETAALQSRLDASEQTAMLLEAETDELRGGLANAHSVVSSLEAQLETAERQVATLETQLAAASRAAAEPSVDVDRIAALETEVIDLRAAIALHATAERDLRHRLAVAESVGEPSEHAEIDADLQRALGRITELESALASQVDQPPSEELVELRQRVTELKARIEAQEDSQQRLRGELAAARSEAERARRSAEEAKEEADRRTAAAAAEVARQSTKVAEFERASRETDKDAARLVVRDAQIADLEERLAGLTAARDSELRRLNDKISSMERLYVEVEARERRVVQLEEEVKELAEARDDAVAALASAERDLVTVQGAHGEALAALERLQHLESELEEARTRIAELESHDEAATLRGEVERLQRTLATERERSARMQRRAALETADEAKKTSSSRTYAEWDRLLRDRVAAAVESASGPLHERIARLRVAIEEKERLISAMSAMQPDPGTDDLKRIRGIGPKIEAILHGMGITEFRRIAQFTDHDVELVGATLPVYGRRILDDRWIEQARELAGE